MIYIFSGCQNICSLPGMCCSACGDACKSCPGGCKAICGPISRGFKGCGGFVKHFFERPLSAYILVSFLVSGYALYAASTDMHTPAKCTSNFLYVLMAFAVINFLFSIYMQCAVWKKIESFKETETETDPPQKWMDGDLPSAEGKASGGMGGMKEKLAARVGGNAPAVAEPVGAKPGYWIVPGEVVVHSFWEIFQKDLVVLAMFIGFSGMAVLSAMGGPKTLDSATPACNIASTTTEMGYAFFGVAFLWCFMYTCCKCCSGAVTVAKENNQYDEVPAEAA